MSQQLPTIKFSTDILQKAIMKEYTLVAQSPDKGYHFHICRAATDRIGYDPALYVALPEDCIASFAGTGNPFCLGPINPDETVIDIGSGAGFDALIAASLVGPGGRVIGIDMTKEMLNKARNSDEAMGATHVEFQHGYADNLPLPDNLADVLYISHIKDLVAICSTCNCQGVHS